MRFTIRARWRTAVAAGFAAVALAGTGAFAADEAPAGPDPALFDRLDADKDGIVTAEEVPGEGRRQFERLLRSADKNGDGKLSREEFAAGLKEPAAGAPLAGGTGGKPDAPLFAKLDRNGDGFVSKDEIPADKREKVDPLWGRADRNGDGKLSREELIGLVVMAEGLRPEGARKAEGEGKTDGTPKAEAKAEAKAEGDRPAPPREGDRSDPRPEGDRPRPAGAPEGRRPDGAGPPRGRLLEVLDGNRDGVLSKEEIAGAAEALGKLDRNGDGVIDATEIGPMGPPQGMAGPPDGPFGPEMMVRRLLSMDRDGDGKLSKEEAPERLRENFDRADRNGDGFIDKAEMEETARVMARLRPEGDRPRVRPEGGRPQPKPEADKPQPKPESRD